MIFTTISYYIDNCDDYILYYNTTKFKTENFYWDNMFNKIKNKISDQCTIKEQFKETEFKYNKIPEYTNDILIDGFFQSDKYFKHNINKIKSILDIDKKIINTKEEYPEYFNRKTIAIHFRIGNYYSLQNMHPIKPVTYYLNALKELSNNDVMLQDYNILIFCQENDNNIVSEYINIINKHYPNMNYKKIADNIPDWKQMLLMMSADHYIIGNSTFSWMGAYLGKKDAIVIAPLIWFGPYYKDNNIDDLRPINWKLVNDKQLS
tara:strand:- start:7563 stop:8351 length:789 start_codon:yes stop_codon:yes gene_type:complete